WPAGWRETGPKANYQVIIIGGGGHGLATAYYLARNHGITDVAVLEKGWIGGGNTGRNTTIVRSNYLLEENARLYEFSLQLWAGLSRELNFNVMYSPRGNLWLGHSDGQMNGLAGLGNALRVRGIDAELLSHKEVQEFVPILNCHAGTRFPVQGGLLQRRGGTVRHDAVAWGYARAADTLGVDIIQNCEVTGMQIEQGRVRGVITTQGTIRANQVAIVTAGHSSHLAAMAGLKLPIESHLLQAMVTEPVKLILHTVVMANAFDCYVSQTDKGEIIINWHGGAETYRHLPAYEIIAYELNQAMGAPTPPLDPAVFDFKDKIVLVGTTATGLYDLKSNPFTREYPGVEAHATVIDNLIHEDVVTRPGVALRLG
ncbi:MAG: FAD-dependent oxidoreductase, partial [Chloroflexota bacterium]